MEVEEYKKSFKIYPEPTAKTLWVSDYNRITVHTQGRMPEKIIRTARPNEPKEVTEYRIENFRAVTRNSFVQAKSNIKRTLSHSAVEIVYPEKLAEYLSDTNFRDTNFRSYMTEFVVDSMIDAANGLLIWWPTNVGEVTESMGVEPIILLPEDIIHYDSEVLTFLSKEKSVVIDGGEPKLTGDVFYIILEEEIWKRVEVGKKGEDDWEWVFYSLNPIGEVYALILGGDEVRKYDEAAKKEITYFTSFFMDAAEFGDECLCRKSDEQGTWISCGSPIRDIEPIECKICKGTGRVSKFDNSGKPIGMDACNGCDNGFHVPTASYGYMVRPKPKTSPGDNTMAISNRPMIGFNHPDVSILEYGGKSWQEYLDRTREALNLLFNKQAQSGIAKEYDREDKLSMLDKLAIHLYPYLFVQSIQIIHKIIFPSDEYPKVSINLPSTFLIKTESELIADLASLRTNNAPDFLIAEVLRELLSKRFGGDLVRMKIFDVLLAIDPLYTKTDGQKAQMLASGGINEDTYQFSIFAYPVLSAYAKQTEGFNDMSIDNIISAVEPLINERAESELGSPDARA